MDALSDLDRGRLIGPIWREYYDHDHTQKLGNLLWVIHGLERWQRNGQDIAPLFDASAADEALSTLAGFLDKPAPKRFEDPRGEAPWTAKERWLSRIGFSATMVCSRLIDTPGPDGCAALVRLLHEATISTLPVKALAARLIGEIEIEKGAIVALHRQVETPLAMAEIDAILTAPALQWPLLFSKFITNIGGSTLWWGEDRDAALAYDLPAYRAFAPDAVAFALARVRAVQSGQEAYRADKLLSQPDAHTVGRAFKLALAENLSWGLEALEEVWRGTAFAPDGQAKTLPSQTLTYQIGRAVIEEPRPGPVVLMAEIARDVRHASVKKRLSRFTKEAITALGQQPDRVLDDLAKGALDPSLSKLVKSALEGLLLRDWDMEARVWFDQMTEASVWPLASRLIWQVGNMTALPKRQAGGLIWVTASGEERGFDTGVRLRLWHPIEATEAERQGWRQVLAAQGLSQPFSQAYREIYPLPEHERAGRETALFAGHRVAQVPMVGLARRCGFVLGFQDEIDLRIGGQVFRFSSGVRAYPGAGGEGETGGIALLGPAGSLAEVPPRVLNEALRRFDLIISAGSVGVEDRLEQADPEWPTMIWPGGQSLKMRQALLRLMRPEAKIKGRWLELGQGARIHLGTGRILRDGTPVELAKKVKAKTTARADDPVMDRIWAAIAAFGLG